MQAAGTPPPEVAGHSWILKSWLSLMMLHKILRVFLKILCMNCLFSLLMASWMNERREMNPFGETSVLLFRLVRKAMMVSDRPELFWRLRISPLPREFLLSWMFFCWILLIRFRG